VRIVVSTARRLPPLDAGDLNGRPRRLPDDLPADPTLVLVAFEQWQQADVDAWVAALPAAPAVEVPLLPRAMRPMARRIDGWMRAGIPDRSTRARTWTAYANVDGWLARLGAPGRDRVVALVAGPDGAVRALARGRPGPSSLPALRAAVGSAA
jgi:hypothetical protein